MNRHSRGPDAWAAQETEARRFVKAIFTQPLKMAQSRKPPMLYPELFKQLESVRWDMDKDIPGQSFDASKLSDEQAQTIKMNAITEWSALPATEMFLRDNQRRQRLLRLHVDLVLRGAEALAGADGVPQALPPRTRAHRAGTARSALRVRAGAGAGNADAAFLRRDPPEPLVPPRRRVAHRAGHQAHLHHAVARTRRVTAAPTCAT